MQIVIDIPETMLDWLKNGYPNEDNMDKLLDLVLNGIPLPKGHGRLKDVDHYIKMQWEHPDYSLIDDEPTTIEADETESEVK